VLGRVAGHPREGVAAPEQAGGGPAGFQAVAQIGEQGQDVGVLVADHHVLHRTRQVGQPARDRRVGEAPAAQLPDDALAGQGAQQAPEHAGVHGAVRGQALDALRAGQQAVGQAELGGPGQAPADQGGTDAAALGPGTDAEHPELGLAVRRELRPTAAGDDEGDAAEDLPGGVHRDGDLGVPGTVVGGEQGLAVLRPDRAVGEIGGVDRLAGGVQRAPLQGASIRHSGCATVGKGDRCGPLRYYASWRKGDVLQGD